MSTMKQASNKKQLNTRRLTPIAAVILALGAGQAYGATWCGGTSGNWTDVSSSCATSPGWVGGVPGAGDSALITSFTNPGSTVTLNSSMGTQTVSIFQLNSGGASNTNALTGNGTLVISNAFEWKGNTTRMSGNGTTTVNGTANILGWGSNGNVMQLGYSDGTSRTLNLNGTTTFQAQNVTAHNGSTIINTGTFNSVGAWTGVGDFKGNSAITSDGTGNTFVNSGTFNQTIGSSIKGPGGPATTTISPAFTNTGTVNVDSGTLAFNGNHDYTQNSGSTIVNGTLSVLDPTKSVLIAGGVLSGGGTISGNVVNVGGFVSPGSSPGKLSITGNFSQSSTGMLFAEIAGPSPQGNLGGYDWLAVSGNAQLGGLLNVMFSYTPTVGQTFEVLTYKSHGQSMFDAIMVEGLRPDLRLNSIYGDTGLTLTVAAVPEPETYAMILAGLGLMTLVMRRRKQ